MWMSRLIRDHIRQPQIKMFSLVSCTHAHAHRRAQSAWKWNIKCSAPSMSIATCFAQSLIRRIFKFCVLGFLLSRFIDNFKVIGNDLRCAFLKSISQFHSNKINTCQFRFYLSFVPIAPNILPLLCCGCRMPFYQMRIKYVYLFRVHRKIPKPFRNERQWIIMIREWKKREREKERCGDSSNGMRKRRSFSA